MPHLSPMNWLMAIMLFWSYLFSISIRKWWNQDKPMLITSNKSSNNHTKWFWL